MLSVTLGFQQLQGRQMGREKEGEGTRPLAHGTLSYDR